MNQVITIVSDGNPDMDEAAAVLYDFMTAGQVSSFGPSQTMGDALYAVVIGDSEAELKAARKEVVAVLTEKKFRIVEGGQL